MGTAEAMNSDFEELLNIFNENGVSKEGVEAVNAPACFIGRAELISNKRAVSPSLARIGRRNLGTCKINCPEILAGPGRVRGAGFRPEPGT
jgi:hypothetical protein